jgi:hypothetical protein
MRIKQCLVLCLAACSVNAAPGTVRFAITGEDGTPLPCRIHLKGAAGKPQRAANLPFFRDHFVCPGAAELALAAGRYSYEIERGPEYERQVGSFDLAPGGEDRVALRLARIADLAAYGWYSGDLHIHRGLDEIELLMAAEDLHVAPVITWWNDANHWARNALPEEPLVRFDGNRFYHVMAGEDEREGGALMYFNRTKPLAIGGSSREYPSPMKFALEARRDTGTWIDIEKPFWWDVPVWLACGVADSIGVANNHMCRSTMLANEAWGRPRDTRRLPPPRGNGFWTQEIYYHALNCGLRIPPSAGSASGVLPNPVGYNRVYVNVGEEFSYARWWEGLKAGRVFVTNGPLLPCRANGELPGHVFTAGAGEAVAIDVRVWFRSRDAVPALEVVRNGHVALSVPLEERAKRGSIGTITFKESGWFLVRAIAENTETFRFASTGPFYVEIGDVTRRISRRSARFFLGWVKERIARVEKNLEDPPQRRAVLAYHERARAYWEEKVRRANAE